MARSKLDGWRREKVGWLCVGFEAHMRLFPATSSRFRYISIRKSMRGMACIWMTGIFGKGVNAVTSNAKPQVQVQITPYINFFTHKAELIDLQTRLVGGNTATSPTSLSSFSVFDPSQLASSDSQFTILQPTSSLDLFFGKGLVEQEEGRKGTFELAAAGAMRPLLSLLAVLLFAAFAAVQAASRTGDRLLVITEDAEEVQRKYSRFLGDFKGTTMYRFA